MPPISRTNAAGRWQAAITSTLASLMKYKTVDGRKYPVVNAYLDAILNMRGWRDHYESNPTIRELWDGDEEERQLEAIRRHFELCEIAIPENTDPLDWFLSDQVGETLDSKFSELTAECSPTGGRLLTYARDHWSRDTDKYRAAELVANGPIGYHEFVSAIWESESDRTRLCNLFHGLCQKINKEVPDARLVRKPKNTVREIS
jgi:hypothetical protein